jgi:glycine/D-amino acid oxidase-like deaminating enzyme
VRPEPSTLRPADVSFWLETSGDDLTARPPLDGSADADVAILGAGYTGLWTAYYLLRQDPSLRVVIAEAEVAGFGASGRNGAWCAPDLNISMDRLAHLHGQDAARRTQQATYDAVDEVGRVAAAEAIDVGFHRGGELIVARGPHQVPAIEEAYREYERFGFADRYQLLDAAEVTERVRVAGAIRGIATPDAAVIHPGRLARNLARLVERLGGRIVERTPVSGWTPRRAGTSARATLHTATGDIRAETIVLAGEAYLTRFPRLHRQLVPVYSLIVLTEPLSDAQWAEIGWADRACLASTRLSVDYLSRTEDGRILFGGRGAPYRFGSPIRDAYDRHDPTHELLRGMVRRWFPVLRDVRFTHAWGGPLGMPRDWHPTIAHDRRTGVATARGYIGHGVSTANLAGRTLAELIRGEETERTTLPLVNHRSPSWEPEPFRWIGVRYAQWALGRIDEQAERTQRAPSGPSLARWMARH